ERRQEADAPAGHGGGAPGSFYGGAEAGYVRIQVAGGDGMKKKLLHIVATVIWIAMLVLLAVFQMPYEVYRIQIQYESDIPLVADQMTLRYESDGQFGFAGG